MQHLAADAFVRRIALHRHVAFLDAALPAVLRLVLRLFGDRELRGRRPVECGIDDRVRLRVSCP